MEEYLKSTREKYKRRPGAKPNFRFVACSRNRFCSRHALHNSRAKSTRLYSLRDAQDDSCPIMDTITDRKFTILPVEDIVCTPLTWIVTSAECHAFLLHAGCLIGIYPKTGIFGGQGSGSFRLPRR